MKHNRILMGVTLQQSSVACWEVSHKQRLEWDYRLKLYYCFIGIVIIHSRESYQPTSMMRWDRDVFDCSNGNNMKISCGNMIWDVRKHTVLWDVPSGVLKHNGKIAGKIILEVGVSPYLYNLI